MPTTNLASDTESTRRLAPSQKKRELSRLFPVFMLVVALHIVEHVVQAYQVYGLHHARPDALGAVGALWPALISSELLHYAHAVFMLVGLYAFRRLFTGRARGWWTAALWLQVWHHFEHFLLLLQAYAGLHLLGRPTPSSIAQLWVPRLELHLFYNVVVLVPMLVAMALRRWPKMSARGTSV
jgi:hypothetical protein